MMMKGSPATDRNPSLRHPGTAWAQSRDQPLVQDRPHHEPVVGDRAPDEPDVDLAAGQGTDLIRRWHIAQGELYLRVGASKSQKHVRHQPQDGRDPEAYPQESGLTARRTLGERDRRR